MSNSISIHFYFGSMTAMRKKLSPQLKEAYEVWHQSGDLSPIAEYIKVSRQHWESVAKECLQLFSEQGDMAANDIEQLVEQNLL